MALRRARIIAALILLCSPGGALAERYAIACSGTQSTTLVRGGDRGITDARRLKSLLYVIDEEARRVSQIIVSRRLTDDMCSVVRETCAVEITPDLVTLSGSVLKDGYITTHSFAFDRKANRLQTVLEVKAGTGQLVREVRSLRCRPAAIPVFD